MEQRRKSFKMGDITKKVEAERFITFSPSFNKSEQFLDNVKDNKIRSMKDSDSADSIGLLTKLFGIGKYREGDVVEVLTAVTPRFRFALVMGVFEYADLTKVCILKLVDEPHYRFVAKQSDLKPTWLRNYVRKRYEGQ